MTVGTIVAIIVAILLIGLVAAFVLRHRGVRDGRSAAAAELSRLNLQPLSPSEREYYLEDWNHIQGSFVDGPGMALDSADNLVRQLLHTVGYPTDDEAKLLRLLSVGHEKGAGAYRDACAVHAKRHSGGEDVDTESMRIAMNGYDTLFQEMVSTHSAPSDTATDTATRMHETEAAR